MSKDIKSQFVDWLRTKDPAETYDYCVARTCAFYQFLAEAGYPVEYVICGFWVDHDNQNHSIPDDIEDVLPGPKLGVSTFGALLDRLTK